MLLKFLYYSLLIIKVYNFNLLNNIILVWGLGIGDWGLGPIPNPQSPIPKDSSIK